MTHIGDEQLAALALDDLDESQAAQTAGHIEACQACRASLAEMRAVLDAAARMPVPRRDEQYGARVWAKLDPALAARQGATPAGIARWRWQPWMAAAAAVVLAVGAFLAGRFTRDAVPPQETAQVTAARLAPEAIRQRVVLAALGEHLDRTERTLVELVNSEPDGRVDISAEQVWARDLLEANRLYRQAAQATPALAQVLDDLEPVLLEIANSPSRLTAAEFETLRDRIEERTARVLADIQDE